MPSKRPAYDESGGINQRQNIVKLAAAAAAAASIGDRADAHDALDSDGSSRPTLDSEAVFNWLQKWSWGKLSSIQVQQEALFNHSDYMRMLNNIPLSEDYMSNSLHLLAQFGNRGNHSGNVNRELKNWLGEPTVPTAKFVRVPLAHQTPGICESVEKGHSMSNLAST